MEVTTLYKTETVSDSFDYSSLENGDRIQSAAAEIKSLVKKTAAYIWETGKNSYNRFVALLDASGNNVNFEPPLFIKYTHSQAADRSGQVGSKYYNKPYLLQYEGFGNLWGIPAGPDANGFWKAEFALKDGTVLGDAKQYKVKALDLELALREKPTSECGALNLSTPDLPAISTFVSPNNGARPVVTGAPAVVEGVVKID